MYYAIISDDIPDSMPLRLEARPAHISRLEALKQEGRLLVAGPTPIADNEDLSVAGVSGSLVIAEFPSLAEAQAWADVDPYVDAGVYERCVVKPYKIVLP
jgi:uncharacterized protein YciI